MKRLIVMRHAKATHKPGYPDLDRPLTARGRRDATAAGAWLRGLDLIPGLVLCSSSCRTRQTWDHLDPVLTGAVAVPGGGSPGPEVWYDTRVYHADLAGLRDVLAETPDDVGTLLVVGHNPTVQQLASSLAGPPGLGFPTSAIAVIEVADWARLDPGAGTVQAFWTPGETGD